MNDKQRRMHVYLHDSTLELMAVVDSHSFIAPIAMELCVGL